MIYYLYKRDTGEYVGTSETPIDCAFVGSTTKTPPQTKEHQKLVFDSDANQWKVVYDFRGVWYNKKTKESIVIDKLGEKVDLTLYTNKRPCEFCVWDDNVNDWVFSLDLYKQHCITKLLEQYQKYLISKENVLRLIGFTSIIARCLVILSTNKTLTDQQIEKLASFIEQSDKLFCWISDVTKYELSLENQLKQATSKSEVDQIMQSVNFEQFDSTYPNISLADKMIFISGLSLE